MSEVGAEEIREVAWPSNGLTEIPFRLYTDSGAVPARAGAGLQGAGLASNRRAF